MAGLKRLEHRPNTSFVFVGHPRTMSAILAECIVDMVWKDHMSCEPCGSDCMPWRSFFVSGVSKDQKLIERTKRAESPPRALHSELTSVSLFRLCSVTLKFLIFEDWSENPQRKFVVLNIPA